MTLTMLSTVIKHILFIAHTNVSGNELISKVLPNYFTNLCKPKGCHELNCRIELIIVDESPQKSVKSGEVVHRQGLVTLRRMVTESTISGCDANLFTLKAIKVFSPQQH